jgi:hypothetical protein
MKKIAILLSLTFFISCTIKPILTPVNIFQVDIGKDGKMYFELIDSHRKVVVKNRSNLPGIHHDVDENNYLPQPFVQYLEKNIIDNLRKSPGLEILNSKDGAEFFISFNLKHFDVYRETSGGAAAAGILVGGLLGAALMEETCTAEIKGIVIVKNINTGEVLCTFNSEVKESVNFSMNDAKKGYKNATQQASSELVKKIILGLTNC